MAQNKQENDKIQKKKQDTNVKSLKVLLAIACALGAAALLIAMFLLGRSSQDNSPTVPPPTETTVNPTVESTEASVPEDTEPPETQALPPVTEVPSKKEIPQLRKGEVVLLGSYKSDEDGLRKQAIQWDVLDVRGSKVLLLSHYALDCIQYNEDYEYITWEKSSIRSWLNDTFLYGAFTNEERQCIDLTHVDNSDSQGFSKWGTSGGQNTEDYVFLLSYAEAKAYFNISGPGTDGPLKARVLPTAYAVAHGAYVSDEYQTADQQFATRWWLRSPGFGQRSAACVHSRGCVGEDKCTNKDTCIRPAMWIDLEKLYG